MAQDCKYTVDKTDPISGKKVQGTKVKINYWFTIAFGREGDEYRVETVVYMPGSQKEGIPAGAHLDLKLNNDQVIILESVSDAIPMSFVSSDQIYSVYSMSYMISHDQAKALAASGLKYSKTHLGAEKYYEHSYKDREIEKTQTAAGCVYGAAAKVSVTPATTPSNDGAVKKPAKADESIVESMMRKKQEKKEKEEAAEKAKNAPAPVADKPEPVVKVTPAPNPGIATPAATAPASAKPAQQGVNVLPLSGADELMKWKKLMDDGIITKEEFDVQKKKILEK